MSTLFHRVLSRLKWFVSNVILGVHITYLVSIELETYILQQTDVYECTLRYDTADTFFIIMIMRLDIVN